MARDGGGRHHAGMRKQYTGKQRSELVDLVRSGRATVAQAASRLGVTPSTAYYWTRAGAPTDGERRTLRSRRERWHPLNEARFVRVVPSGAAVEAIAVKVGAAEVQVRRGFDPEFLRAVVEALGGAA